MSAGVGSGGGRSGAGASNAGMSDGGAGRSGGGGGGVFGDLPTHCRFRRPDSAGSSVPCATISHLTRRRFSRRVLPPQSMVCWPSYELNSVTRPVTSNTDRRMVQPTRAPSHGGLDGGGGSEGCGGGGSEGCGGGGAG